MHVVCHAAPTFGRRPTSHCTAPHRIASQRTHNKEFNQIYAILINWSNKMLCLYYCNNVDWNWNMAHDIIYNLRIKLIICTQFWWFNCFPFGCYSFGLSIFVTHDSLKYKRCAAETSCAISIISVPLIWSANDVDKLHFLMTFTKSKNYSIDHLVLHIVILLKKGWCRCHNKMTKFAFTHFENVSS